jgi:olefin beta-lactone synthetase
VNLVGLFDERAGSRPDATAIVACSGGAAVRWTFAQMRATSSRWATVLAEHGVEPGARVALLVPMSPELYVALLAVWRVGALAVLVDAGAGLDRLSRCVGAIRPEAMIGSGAAHALRLVSAPVRRIPLRFSIGATVPFAVRLDGVGERSAESARVPLEEDAPALVTFTSGSTGSPKIAVRTHAFLRAQYEVLARAIELAPGQTDLTTLPVFLLANLAAGVTSVVPDADMRRVGEISARPVLEQIRREQVSRMGASPAFVDRLVSACEREGATLPSIERVFIGGAPVFPSLLRRVRSAMPEACVTAVYGSTEAEPIAEVALEDVSDDDFTRMATGAGLLAGRSVPEIDLRIITSEPGVPIPPATAAGLEAMRVSEGRAGEIVVAGPHVLTGYLDGRGDAEAKIDVDGRRWHRTGDIGRLDDAGRLWLLGRASAVVRDERGEVHPFTVECAASEIEGIARSAFVSWGGRRALVVESAPGRAPDPDAVRAALEWAGIDVVHRVARIPVDVRHNAKVDYPALCRLLAREFRDS